MRAASFAFAASAVLALVACETLPPPPPPTPAPATPATDSAPPVASEAPAAPSAPKQRPLELTSACPHDLHLYFGGQPGDGKGATATVSTGQTLQVPRQPDGTNVVWVVDEKGAGLASVNITKHMRHIRIDAACARIDADSTR
jgi:hypothetical protein